MKFYVLFNRRLEQYLTHPRLGIWHTSLYLDAVKMLNDCKTYVHQLNIEHYENDFVIQEMTQEEYFRLGRGE